MKNKKQVLATFILTSTIFTGVTSYYYNGKLNLKNEEIVQLHKQQELRDSEIANLRDKVKENKKTIKIKDDKLEEFNSEIKKQEKAIKKLKRSNEILKLKNAKLKQRATVKKVSNNSNSNFSEKKEGSVAEGRRMDASVTAYFSQCEEGCSGVTATGIDVRNTVTYQGHRIIATDPHVIPLYSIVKINLDNGQSFTAISLDTGGAIKGNIIDYLVSSKSEAITFGRHSATVTFIREGK